jgi:hypothetical protein
MQIGRSWPSGQINAIDGYLLINVNAFFLRKTTGVRSCNVHQGPDFDRNSNQLVILNTQAIGLLEVGALRPSPGSSPGQIDRSLLKSFREDDLREARADLLRLEGADVAKGGPDAIAVEGSGFTALIEGGAAGAPGIDGRRIEQQRPGRRPARTVHKSRQFSLNQLP